MKKILLFIITLISASATFAQHSSHKRKHYSPHVIYINEKYLQCLRKNKYSPAQRLKFYPFNKAKQVKLVAFEDYLGAQPNVQITIGDTIKTPNYDSIWKARVPFKKAGVDYSTFKEIKTLNKTQVDQLTDLLYNIGYAGPKQVEPGSKCYDPRNAILFIDSRGRTFAYIEICFECQEYRVSSKKLMLGEFCEQKLDRIKSFFKSAGVELGVTRTEYAKFTAP
jgi:hypothetical protein